MSSKLGKVLIFGTLNENNNWTINEINCGTVAWTVFRIALHAFNHITQMTYIFHNFGVYKDTGDRWWNTTEEIITLNTLVQINQNYFINQFNFDLD